MRAAEKRARTFTRRPSIDDDDAAAADDDDDDDDGDHSD